jgi:hypothetical protein
MRHLPLLMIFGLFLGFFAMQTAATNPASRETPPAVTPYDSNRNHPWNRLHEALFVREDANGVRHGSDSLDPVLWRNSTYLLAAPSHQRAVQALDDFLQAHSENLIHDPVKRAILRHDLWAIFDWSVEEEPGSGGHDDFRQQKHDLQVRLAEVLRRLALSAKQIESMSDNYGQAVASHEFGKTYNPEHRDAAFLPPDLFEQHGSWVNIESIGDSEPMAPLHMAAVSGRSRFLVFLRLPEGRLLAETLGISGALDRAR